MDLAARHTSAAAWGDRGFHKARLVDALLADDAPLGPATTLQG